MSAATRASVETMRVFMGTILPRNPILGTSFRPRIITTAMANKQFLKDNFALIVGLALPVLLMAGFLVVANLPSTLADPPKYDLVFAVPDYQANVQNLPVAVRLVV